MRAARCGGSRDDTRCARSCISEASRPAHEPRDRAVEPSSAEGTSYASYASKWAAAAAAGVIPAHSASDEGGGAGSGRDARIGSTSTSTSVAPVPRPRSGPPRLPERRRRHARQQRRTPRKRAVRSERVVTAAHTRARTVGVGAAPIVMRSSAASAPLSVSGSPTAGATTR